MKKKNSINTSENEPEILTIDLDDGETLDCQILNILTVDGQDYIYLMPPENYPNADDGEFFIYKYFEDGNEEITLDNNLSDEEFEKASDAFDELLDEQEYFELVESDEDNQYSEK